MNSSLETEFKELMKKAVREVIYEEIEKGTLAKPSTPSQNVSETMFETHQFKK
jgi:hypothetical protein